MNKVVWVVFLETHKNHHILQPSENQQQRLKTALAAAVLRLRIRARCHPTDKGPKIPKIPTASRHHFRFGAESEKEFLVTSNPS